METQPQMRPQAPCQRSELHTWVTGSVTMETVDAVLLSAPHCLTPFAPQVSSVEAKSPPDGHSRFPIQPARQLLSLKGHLRGCWGRRPEDSPPASPRSFVPLPGGRHGLSSLAWDIAKTPNGKIPAAPFPAVFWMRINPELWVNFEHSPAPIHPCPFCL